MIDEIKAKLKKLNKLKEQEKIKAINEIKLELHKYSPFKNQPVDCVLWIRSNQVKANDYNPNKVAPPEMKLLEHSIREDGYTQPIVVWPQNGHYQVIDGFHRNRVGKEIMDINYKVKNYLPVSIINTEREKRNDRIAATIRHNRARGKHSVDGMSDIVVELKRRNWSNEKISKELGMDEDEILRLCQITGLSELFLDQEFSKSWDIVEDTEIDFDHLSDNENDFENDIKEIRTVNTSDPDRIFHKWDKWECYKAGFYNTTKKGMTKKQCEEIYCKFLKNLQYFEETLQKIISEWKYSCEHYLTNNSMNRIAWLGQAACCYAEGIPAVYRSGFWLLSDDEQKKANELALKYLNMWLKNNGLNEVTMQEAISINQSDLY